MLHRERGLHGPVSWVARGWGVCCFLSLGRNLESEDLLSWVVTLALEVLKLLPGAGRCFTCLPLPP